MCKKSQAVSERCQGVVRFESGRDVEDLRIYTGCFETSSAGWETAEDSSARQLNEEKNSGKQRIAAQHFHRQAESSECYIAGLGIRAAFQIKRSRLKELFCGCSIPLVTRNTTFESSTSIIE